MGKRDSGRARDRAIVAALGAWFDTNARDLPWRRRRDAYAVWLSEIMLQQTRVETVIPYFERFLSRYPGVDDLARAELDEVLSLWSGLGYYRRARELLSCARTVVDKHEGRFPSTAATLRSLPGIGPYTAGAIASLSFGEQTPLLDGNVARVFARLDGVRESIRDAKIVKQLWARAAELVPRERPGRFNEALMELGAMVCTPRAPRCGACPLATLCVARREGLEGELHVVEAKPKVPIVTMVAAVLRRREDPRVLLARRAEGGLFGGLWEPPMVEASSIDDARPALAGAGIDGSVELAASGKVKHVLSHRELRVLVAVGELPAKLPARTSSRLSTAPYEKNEWLDPEVSSVGISTLARKILRAARR